MWATLAQARTLWPDAPADDALLTSLLEAAQTVCEAFAPISTDPVPANYTQAVVFTARDTWASRTANLEGDVLAPGYGWTPPAMSPQVRRLLRPDRGLMVG